MMVWIHGGGFQAGASSEPRQDGTNLAKKGVVVVSMNYRMGVFGFMAHPELTKESGHNASGNYGMMDALAALQWVKKNISAFGGDPNNVTVAGESAGAIMVGALVGSPQAKGLFHRAIAELRAKPMNELTGLSAGGLVIDGYLIPEDISLTFASGRQNAVDVLTGSNKDEANFGVCGGGRGPAAGGSPIDHRRQHLPPGVRAGALAAGAAGRGRGGGGDGERRGQGARPGSRGRGWTVVCRLM